MLITAEDISAALNIDLTEQGQESAESLILATQAHFSKIIGFPIEEAEVTTWLDGQYRQHWLPTSAPVINLTVQTRNSFGTYDTLSATYVLHDGLREVYISSSLSSSPFSTKAVYTTGWTVDSLPDDLRLALIDVVGLKLQAIGNFSAQPPGTETEGEEETTSAPTLKRVTSGAYTEEYASAESDAYWKAKTAAMSRSIGEGIPQTILNVVESYRPPFAI